MSQTHTEQFQPPAHQAPDSGFGAKLLFYTRMLADFQFNSIYKFMKKNLPGLTGRVLDVGCGNSPFRHLLNTAETTYTGVDIYDASNFQYNAKDVIKFDGVHLPIESESVDHIICTEVLEHASEPDELCAEMLRVLKPHGTAYITIPWSARFHYIPHDYSRFTPTRIKQLFHTTSSIAIEPRGSDVTVISNKIIVIYMRSLRPRGWLYPLRLLAILLTLPLLVSAVIIGLLSLCIPVVGSTDDPLGYSITVKKQVATGK